MTTHQLALITDVPHRDGAAFALRPYQADCLYALRKFGMQGHKRGLIAMATGLGKTVVFAEMAGKAKKKMLVIAHREELLAQAKDKILRANPHLSVEIEQAANKASMSADVVVASVQTFAVNPARLHRWAPDEFSAVIVDEAHHAVARTYLEVLSYFGLVPAIADLKDGDLARSHIRQEVRERFESFKPAASAPFLAGFTATPTRTDARGLEYIFDDIVYSMTIRDGIEGRWLVPIKGQRITTGTNISEVKLSRGDFQERALSNAVNTDERNALAVNAYRQHAEGRQALVFCVDVEHTKAMTQAFRSAGYKAEYVVGSKKDMEKPREDVIADYQRSAVQVLVNCMVLTEGFDAPETSALIMARPTKSTLLYTQMMGRGTRLAPGKADLLVLDMVDVASKAGVNSVNTLFGLPPHLDFGESDVLTAAKEIEELGDVPLAMFEQAASIPELRTLAEQFDPLMQAQVEEWLRTALSWTKTAFGYAISVPGNGEARAPLQIGVVVNMLGQADVRVKHRSQKPQYLARNEDVQTAISMAEDWVSRHVPDAGALLDKNAGWHSDAPSEKQLRFAERLKIKVNESMTKGDLSKLIDAKMAGKR